MEKISEHFDAVTVVTNLDLPREGWREFAACTGVDTATIREFYEGSSRARIICINDCPVREDCLVEALDNREPASMWGGENELKRRKYVTLRKRAIRQASKIIDLS